MEKHSGPGPDQASRPTPGSGLSSWRTSARRVALSLLRARQQDPGHRSGPARGHRFEGVKPAARCHASLRSPFWTQRTRVRNSGTLGPTRCSPLRLHSTSKPDPRSLPSDPLWPSRSGEATRSCDHCRSRRPTPLRTKHSGPKRAAAAEATGRPSS